MKTLRQILTIVVSVFSLSSFSSVNAQPLYDFIDLGTLGGKNSCAYSVNAYGQIVGIAENSAGFFRAVFFDISGSGQNIDLGTLGGENSCAYSVNRYGQIVGTAQDNSGLYKAAFFDISGDGNNINLAGAGGSGGVHSDNKYGQIVGAFGDYSINTEAVFFESADGDNIYLNDAVDMPSGWILQQAYCVNDYGWIVGRAYNSAGFMHAFLLIPTSGIYPQIDNYNPSILPENYNYNPSIFPPNYNYNPSIYQQNDSSSDYPSQKISIDFTEISYNAQKWLE